MAILCGIHLVYRSGLTDQSQAGLPDEDVRLRGD